MACLVSSWGERFVWVEAELVCWMELESPWGGDGDSYMLGRLQDLRSVSSCLALDRQTAKLKHATLFSSTGQELMYKCGVGRVRRMVRCYSSRFRGGWMLELVLFKRSY